MRKFYIQILFLFASISILLPIMTLNSIAQEAKDPWAQTPPRPISLSGKIESPTNNSNVTRHFYIKGTIKGQYRHLWLVERIGDLHWPKEPELTPTSGKWKGEVFEGGWPPEGKFEILLIDVSEETSNAFRQWLAEGHRTGNYPGLTADKLGSFIAVDRRQYKIGLKQ